MNRSLRFAFAAALLCAGAAAADTTASATYTKDNYPTQVILRPLVLPVGMLELDGSIVSNFSSSDAVGNSRVFKPIFFSPSITYGVSQGLQVSLLTSGFCLTGTDSGCPRVFDDLALEADYVIAHQKGFDAAFQVALGVRSFGDSANPSDPFQPDLGLGVDLRLVQDNLAVRAGPKLVFGLSGRDQTFNREYLQIPINFFYQADPHLALFAGLDLNLMLDPQDPFGFGDFFTVPVRVGALYSVTKMFDFGAVFQLDNFLGKHIDKTEGALDLRSITVFVAFRPDL